jgi:UDP-N-acetylmuramoyl-tripeptide--D-alanyl-D-alanine ligase
MISALLHQMKIIITIFGFLIFIKLLFFWLWLWQLKEYHHGRLKAHFETQAIRKVFSGFYRLKFPKFTKKMIVISVSGIFLAILITYFIFFLPNDKDFYLALLIFIFSAPFFATFIILFFQISTGILCWRTLQEAKKKREQFKNLLVVAIVGSYGKTSTKEFLTAILSGKFNVLKTEEHINAEIGIAQTILNNLNENHQIFICEIGAYDKGKVKEVCEIIKPKIGIITGVSEQHLGVFGSMEDLLSAEGGKELIENLSRSQLRVILRGLPLDTMVFFNVKNKYCSELYEKTSIKKFFYGENVEMPGLENIEGAKAIAKELGMSEKEIFKAAKKIKNKFPGVQIKKGVNGLNIIDASYSANPDGAMAHLEFLKTFPESVKESPLACCETRKIIIMPCLIELGPASSEIHCKIGKKIAEVCNLAIITTKDYFNEIKNEAIKNKMNPENILCLENSKEILEKIKNFCKQDDAVLLEGRIPNQVINFLTF